jgi:NAD-dependent SIR2 family protein deacetylase
MIHQNDNVAEKTAILKAALDKAEAIIIGAGAGLSSAAGLAYDNADTFNALFPGYHDRYGLKTISDEPNFVKQTDYHKITCYAKYRLTHFFHQFR